MPIRMDGKSLVAWLARVLAMGAGVVCAGAIAVAEPARRIVSLNLCTDQLVVDLVPPERIAALSRLAADPKLSTVAERARQLPATNGSAEDVLARDPDLILTAEHAAPQTVALLRRLGRTVVTVPLAQDFDGFRDGVRRVAAAVGEPATGERVIADFDRRLAGIAPGAVPGAAMGAARRPTALAWEINRLSAGRGTLVDAVIGAAGLDNGARRLRLGAGGVLPLESILASPPDVLVLANAADDYRTTAADNLRHPALAAVMTGRETVALPMPLWLCASPRTVEAVELLAAARARVVAQVARP